MIRARRHVAPLLAILLALPILIPACQKAPPRGAWRIVPRDASTALGKNSGSEEELRKAYGRENVTEGPIDRGGGRFSPGTILFPGDPLRRIEVVWQDSLHHMIPARVFLRGERSM